MGQLPTNGNARNPGRNPPLEYFKGIFEGDARSSPRSRQAPFSPFLCPEILASSSTCLSLSPSPCSGTSDFLSKTFGFFFFRKGIKRGSRDSKGWRKVGQERGGIEWVESYQNSRLRNFSDGDRRHHPPCQRSGGNSNFPRNSDLFKEKRKKERKEKGK